VKLEVNGGDELAKFAQLLAAASDGKARKAMSRALNAEGDKGRTAIRRALAQQTALPYGQVIRGTRTTRSYAENLSYTLHVSGKAVNVGKFHPRKMLHGVNASPWGISRRFIHAFMLPSRGMNVFIRETGERLPIRQVWGPRLGAEAVKDKSREAFEAIGPKLAPAVLRVVAHEFGL
jgi:hypothetical protein